MMRLWLSKSGAVSLRDQLITQLTLGMISGDLPPGQRLPSTRALARRFRVHPNTISAAYRELARRGWVERRRGSGVYVRHPEFQATARGQLEASIAAFLRALRESGFSHGEIRRAVIAKLDARPPDHFLVIESDDELRRILMAEIATATNRRVEGATPEECAASDAMLAGAMLVTLYGNATRVRATLPPNSTALPLRSRSIAESLRASAVPPRDALIAIVSRWPGFLERARAMLVAAGLDPDALSFHDARRRDWRRGLSSAYFVIADSVTARLVPTACEVRVFRIIADASLDDLRERFDSVQVETDTPQSPR